MAIVGAWGRRVKDVSRIAAVRLLIGSEQARRFGDPAMTRRPSVSV